MKIIKLEITNYKGIKSLKIENPPDLLILIGTNGSGKSSVLTALNEILKYCLGAIGKYPYGIGIVLDLNDHIGDIKSWFENNLDDENKKATFFSNSGLFLNVPYPPSLIKFAQYFLNDVLPFFLKKPIIEFQDGRVHYTFENSISNDEFKNFSFNSQYPIEDYGYWLGRLIHLWLIQRANNNPLIPGVAYLNTENTTFRNAIISQSQIKSIFNGRIQNLIDQNWRSNQLGTRLVGLILNFHKNKSEHPNSELEDPVEKLNKSLKYFVPHLTLLSPGVNEEFNFRIRNSIVNIKDLSSGELTLINYAIDYLEMEINQGVLIIDEPDAHLHYDLQSQLIPFLKELVKSTKNGNEIYPTIWLATHSPPTIQSAPIESIYTINMDKEKTTIQSFKEIEGQKSKNELLQFLGISQYFDRRPVLYVEGGSDTRIITKIINETIPELSNKWKIKETNGTETITKIKSYLEGLKAIQTNLKDEDLLKLIHQYYFLQDGDNKPNNTESEENFRWKFYHIENLLFQDPWLNSLNRYLRVLKKGEKDIQEAFKQAKGEAFGRMVEKPALSIEKLEPDVWKDILPGRDLYNALKKHLKFNKNIDEILSLMIEDSKTNNEYPKELNRFTTWVKAAYERWSSN